MSWQVGDLAVCVDVSMRFGTGGLFLAMGKAYKVTQTGYCHRRDRALVWLDGLASLDGLTPGAFAAERFRKISPDKHEACETEFVTLLKRSRVSA